MASLSGERQSTLSGQLRALRPPDSARQALRELDGLARALASIPSALEQAGCVRELREEYFETVAAYTELARAAWQATAEERLEQIGADPLYRQFAGSIARAIADLRESAATGQDGLQDLTGSRPPWLWRARIALVRRGLRRWQTSLDQPADPLRLGAALFTLRGSLSLALAGAFELLSLRLLTGVALVALPLVSVGLAFAMVSPLVARHGTPAMPLAVGALMSLVLWGVVLRLAALGQVRLGFALGACGCSPTASPGNGRPGSVLLRVLVRGWWEVVGMAGALATLAALAFSIRRAIDGGALPVRSSLAIWLGQLGQRIVEISAPPALVAVVGLASLAVPVMAVVVVRMAGELSGNDTWIPAARRYALGPSASAVALLSGALFAAVAWGATAVGLQRATVLRIQLGVLSLTPTARAMALFAALALPYLLLHDLPYRVGIARWRPRWLGELALRHAELEAHVRRLSAADPLTGLQDTSDENLRAMEYDLLLLAYYRAKEAEARRVPAAPHRLLALVLVLALTLLLALATDGAGTWLFVLR